MFSANLEFIRSHNAEGHTYQLGVGPFADMTNDEFKATLGLGEQRFFPKEEPDEVWLPEVEAPRDGVDWRTKGAVTPVKNQGHCGGCWAFSTTGSVEGAWKIAGNDLPITGCGPTGCGFSEEQLMDCSKKFGNKGCEGGIMEAAFRYIISNKGLNTETAYPFVGKDEACDTEKEAQQVGTISSFKDVPPKQEAQLLAAVTQQPVSVAIEADKPVFQHYKSGVMSDLSCGVKLDHGVLLVGYGTDPVGGDYWILKCVPGLLPRPPVGPLAHALTFWCAGTRGRRCGETRATCILSAVSTRRTACAA